MQTLAHTRWGTAPGEGSAAAGQGSQAVRWPVRALGVLSQYVAGVDLSTCQIPYVFL